MKDLPIRYVLYSHYGTFENEDKKASETGVAVGDLPSVEYLRHHMRGLHELLTTPGHEGVLVLFYYARALPEFLKAIADGDDEESLTDSTGLGFASKVATYVRELLAQNDLADRVRFVTPIDLKVILGQVHAILADSFQEYFVGPAEGIRYDTPKIVESIIRLRLLGNGVPVLRLDSDVLFRFKPPAKVIGDLGLFKAIACATHAYHLRMNDHTVSTFIFSASYNARALQEGGAETDRFEAWSRAFATRVHPALIADPSAVSTILDKVNTDRTAAGKITDSAMKKAALDSVKAAEEAAWNEYVKSHLDDDVLRQFFGLKQSGRGFDCDGTSGIAEIGAHPYYAVISGALLCLSEGAILDLPPFSNFRNNVMWIDDHLKYSLHRALDHFTSGETLNLEPGLSDARLDEVTVTKARPAVVNLPKYAFQTYLPTVLLGCVMDSWITADSILKRRVSMLDGDLRERWRAARNRERLAPLPRAILTVLQSGRFDKSTRRQLRTDLEQRAIARLQEVRNQWSALRSGERRSFASYWAVGDVEANFKAEYFDAQDTLWRGLTPDLQEQQPIRSLQETNVAVYSKVTQLIEDAVSYVEWLLDWPRFVQIVRSVPQGTFCGDLAWRSSR